MVMVLVSFGHVLHFRYYQNEISKKVKMAPLGCWLTSFVWLWCGTMELKFLWSCIQGRRKIWKSGVASITVGIICSPLVEIGLTDLPKSGGTTRDDRPGIGHFSIQQMTYNGVDKVCFTLYLALKFIYSEKATKFCEISTLLLLLTDTK